MPRRESRSALDAAAMSDSDSLDQQRAVMDFVDDSVIPNPDSVGRALTDHGDAAGRLGRISQKIDGGSDALLLLAR